MRRQVILLALTILILLLLACTDDPERFEWFEEVNQRQREGLPLDEETE